MNSLNIIAKRNRSPKKQAEYNKNKVSMEGAQEGIIQKQQLRLKQQTNSIQRNIATNIKTHGEHKGRIEKQNMQEKHNPRRQTEPEVTKHTSQATPQINKANNTKRETQQYLERVIQQPHHPLRTQ